MGNRGKHIYQASVLAGKPTLWAATPIGILASDCGDTIIQAILAGVGCSAISFWAQNIFTHNIDPNACAAWGIGAFGFVLSAPVAGDVVADFITDIRMGIERSEIVENDPEPEPAPPPEPTEDEAGAARVPGRWWYKDARGREKCYHTPVGQAKGMERPKPIISDARMQAIFTRIANGVPFSERRLCERDSKDRVPGLSGSQFRELQDDWCHPTRLLYKLRPDKSGYFTPAGKRIAEAIRTAEL